MKKTFMVILFTLFSYSLLFGLAIEDSSDKRFEVIYRESIPAPEIWMSGIMGYEIILDKKTGEKYVNFRCEKSSTVIRMGGKDEDPKLVGPYSCDGEDCIHDEHSNYVIVGAWSTSG